MTVEHPAPQVSDEEWIVESPRAVGWISAELHVPHQHYRVGLTLDAEGLAVEISDGCTVNSTCCCEVPLSVLRDMIARLEAKGGG